MPLLHPLAGSRYPGSGSVTPRDWQQEPKPGGGTACSRCRASRPAPRPSRQRPNRHRNAATTGQTQQDRRNREKTRQTTQNPAHCSSRQHIASLSRTLAMKQPTDPPSLLACACAGAGRDQSLFALQHWQGKSTNKPFDGLVGLPALPNVPKAPQPVAGQSARRRPGGRADSSRVCEGCA